MKPKRKMPPEMVAAMEKMQGKSDHKPAHHAPPKKKASGKKK